MAKSSIWAALAGGLGAVSNQMLTQRMQEWEQKLKEQERDLEEKRQLRMNEAKLRQAEESAVRQRAGSIQGTPVLDPATGQYSGWGYDETGKQFGLRPIEGAKAPEGLLEQMRQQTEFERQKQQLGLLNTQAQIQQRQASATAANAQAGASGARAGYYAARTENPERFMRSGAATQPKPPSPTDLKNAREIAEEDVARAMGIRLSDGNLPSTTSPEKKKAYEDAVKRRMNDVLRQTGRAVQQSEFDAASFLSQFQ